jgi:primary-amine oxidase
MPTHPLEPLDAAEIKAAIDLLKRNSLLTPTSRVISISLKEPGKVEVFRWPESLSRDRFAVSVLFDNATNTASIVTLNLMDPC